MFRKLLFYILLAILFWNCARKGTPKGGPIDTYAPKILKEFPKNRSINVPVDIKEVRIELDEYAVLKDASKQILISPAFQNTPTITPSQNSPKKYISIKIRDSLKPNTTYNFNFGESIQDNTEGNAISGYQYTFSTGNYIDSLQLNGNIVNTNEEVIDLNTVVALYEKDKVDLRKKPFYVTKIDTLGNFKLKYLSEGEYEIVSFLDKNGNIIQDEDEEFGFGKKPIKINDSTQNITIFISKITPKIAFDKAETTGEGQITVFLKGKPKSIELIPISTTFPKEYIVQHKNYSDTATIWFNPKKGSFENKTNRVEFQLGLADKKDTIAVTYNIKKESDLSLTTDLKNIKKSNALRIESSNYIQSIDKNLIDIKKGENTVNFSVAQHETFFYLEFPIDFDSKYTITMQPKAVVDFLGKTHEKIEVDFFTQSPRDYGNLKVTLTQFPTKPFFIQLLNNDKVSVSQYIRNTNGVVEFLYLNPEEYTMRLLVDENENGIWDSGNWELKQQPEATFYYPNYIQIRAFWDINESWNVK